MGTPMEKTRKVQASEPASRPAFSRIMYPVNLIDLKIPTDFMKHLATDYTNRATLKTPGGIWEVRVVKHKGDFYLLQGWQEFVKKNHLGDQEYLVFYYNGRMRFDVDIYEKSGWKRRTYREPGSSFTSRHPYFKFKMCSYNIGSKSMLIIPSNFHSKHFDISVKTSVVLRNPDGVSWLVTVIVNFNKWKKKQLIISQGWKRFADDNSLKIGDTCIFEFVEPKMMQVHIFRST